MHNNAICSGVGIGRGGISDAPISPLEQLARLPRDTFLNGEELARILGKCRKSIGRAEARGELPPAVKFLGNKRWSAESIIDHLTRMQEEQINKQDRREARRPRA